MLLHNVHAVPALHMPLLGVFPSCSHLHMLEQTCVVHIGPNDDGMLIEQECAVHVLVAQAMCPPPVYAFLWIQGLRLPATPSACMLHLHIVIAGVHLSHATPASL